MELYLWTPRMSYYDLLSYYDIMRIVGKLAISKDSQPFQNHLENRLVTGLQEDEWKQTLGKIMFGDGLTWCMIISIPY